MSSKRTADADADADAPISPGGKKKKMRPSAGDGKIELSVSEVMFLFDMKTFGLVTNKHALVKATVVDARHKSTAHQKTAQVWVPFSAFKGREDLPKCSVSKERAGMVVLESAAEADGDQDTPMWGRVLADKSFFPWQASRDLQSKAGAGLQAHTDTQKRVHKAFKKHANQVVMQCADCAHILPTDAFPNAGHGGKNLCSHCMDHAATGGGKNCQTDVDEAATAASTTTNATDSSIDDTEGPLRKKSRTHAPAPTFHQFVTR